MFEKESCETIFKDHNPISLWYEVSPRQRA